MKNLKAINTPNLVEFLQSSLTKLMMDIGTYWISLEARPLSKQGEFA